MLSVSLWTKTLRQCVFVILVGSIATVSAAQQQKPPTCDTEQHRQFDFWVGSWVVTDRDENVLDYNNIELHLNGCTLQENWKGAKGSTGKSFNFCDRQTKQRHQTWIDNSGWALYLDDGLEGNVMVLSGKHMGREGKPIVHKISYTPEEIGVVK